MDVAVAHAFLMDGIGPRQSRGPMVLFLAFEEGLAGGAGGIGLFEDGRGFAAEDEMDGRFDQ